MSDARCEPPEHLRGVSGWHWIQAPSERDPHPEWWKADMGWRGCREGIGAHWRYVAPVPSPEAVRALVEAARRVDAPCMGDTDEPFDACPRCAANADQQCGDEFREHAFAALRAALAAFPEPQP